MIGGDALQFPDGNRFVHFKAAAAFFTTMGAYAAKYTRKGKIPHNDFNSFPVLAFLDHGNIALNIQIGRASHPARGRIEFLYGKAAGNGLRIWFVNGFTESQFHVVFAGSRHRADFRTVTTGRTFIEIDIARSFVNGYLEVSIFPLNAFNI